MDGRLVRGAIGMITAVCMTAVPQRMILGQGHRVATGTEVHTAWERRRVTFDVDQMPLRAVLEIIARQAGLSPIYAPTVVPAQVRVTLQARDLLVGEAFRRVLQGTGLAAKIYAEGDVSIVAEDGAAVHSGTITGTVIDSRTKRPLGGVMVLLDDATPGVLSAEDGTFRLTGVSVGTHHLTTRLLGYARAVTTVNVGETIATAVNIVLTASANTLDQVVVTGTIIPTELKAVPNAITVITAKQIEERGITKIDQLFHGDVPGLFAQNQGSNAVLDEVIMFSRGATALSSSSAGTSQTNDGSFMFTNPIKTYVDGVELADPKYLSQIDPKSIERIEILTGPQASTIYGSNAMNGVMQIFTKRGASSTPQLTLNLLSGWVENNFSSARTPQHDYDAQLSGIEGRMSYNAGGSWNYTGPWTPAKQMARIGSFGGGRLELLTRRGRATADVTFRRTTTQSQQHGDSRQTLASYRETGWYSVVGNAGLSVPSTSVLNGQTLGLAFGYIPTNWWSHELGIGQDASDTELRYTARGYAFVSDTVLRLAQTHTDRRSLRYTTTARVPIASLAQATITVGADAWQNLATSLTVSPQTLTGTLASTSSSVTRQPGHNTGAFLQTQLGILENLFFTYGLRAEWNPNYGAEAEPNYAPRYGVAYTQAVGPLTAKLRASYGRSTRPPAPNLKTAQTISQVSPFLASLWGPDYGNFNVLLANPSLGPEHQQGGEGGLELYWGTRGSLIVTRYNQTVDGLIASPPVDSVRSFAPNPASGSSSGILDSNGYGYRYQQQYLNVASIRNQGWELQGSVNTGPFTTRGTYSWTKSRALGTTPKYRAVLKSAQYQPGATFQYLPEHTWALGVTYAHSQTSVGLNFTGIGRVANINDDFFFQHLAGAIRLPQNRFSVTGTNYINFNPSYAMADLTASRRFAAQVEGVLFVQNLTNRYTNDLNATFATLGRQLKAGLRIHSQ